MARKITYIAIDCSGSIRDCDRHSRGSALNAAMKNVMERAIPEIIANADAQAEHYIAVLSFSGDSVEWLIEPNPMETVGETGWVDIAQEKFNGKTPTGKAIREIVKDIKGERNDGQHGDGPVMNAIPPTIILISDGEPTDDYDVALQEAITSCSAFKRANRVAIGVQVDDAGRESLKDFGRVSARIQESVQSYYDCTDDNTAGLIEVIRHVTVAASI